jgi:hypothetical protein
MRCTKCLRQMRKSVVLQEAYWSCPQCDWDEPAEAEETLKLPIVEYEYLFSAITDIAFLHKALSSMTKKHPRLKMPRRCPSSYGQYTTLRVPKHFILAYDGTDAWVDTKAPFEILNPSKGCGLGEWECL